MKFLVTNDDGIAAPGLSALERAANQLGEVVVVAPRDLQSGCSHQTTTSRSLERSPHGHNRYALDGTPVDCARVGLLYLAADADWVLAGVNDGGNLGIDVLMSGTVAAAREAALLGRRAIAISHYRRGAQKIDWETASEVTAPLLRELFTRPLPPGSFWNVNYPAQLDAANVEFVDCPLDTKPLPVEFSTTESTYRYCGNYHRRARDPGTDVDICFEGAIAISRVRVCIG